MRFETKEGTGGRGGVPASRSLNPLKPSDVEPERENELKQKAY